MLADPTKAFVSRYALGRDYHKVLRASSAQLAERIRAAVGEFGYRVFTDSAPVLEVALAARAGLGWRGKHTLLLTRDSGLVVLPGRDLHRPAAAGDAAAIRALRHLHAPASTSARRGAIVAPYELDARRCISYLTIEHDGSIPQELRPLIGNRIYGCDDCQLVCPWNRFAQASTRARFRRPQRTRRRRAGRAVRVDAKRVRDADGRQRDPPHRLRALVCATSRWRWATRRRAADIIAALEAARRRPSPLVREHVAWALARQRAQRLDN